MVPHQLHQFVVALRVRTRVSGWDGGYLCLCGTGSYVSAAEVAQVSLCHPIKSRAAGSEDSDGSRKVQGSRQVCFLQRNRVRVKQVIFFP